MTEPNALFSEESLEEPKDDDELDFPEGYSSSPRDVAVADPTVKDRTDELVPDTLKSGKGRRLKGTEPPPQQQQQQQQQQQPQVVVNVSGDSKQQTPTKDKKAKTPPVPIEEVETNDIDATLESIGLGEPEMYIALYRLEPKSHMGRQIHGYLDRFDTQLSLQDIKQLYGGGKYDLCVYGPRKFYDGKTKVRLIRRVRFFIGGLPKLDDAATKEGGGGSLDIGGSPDLAKSVLSQSMQLVESAQADKARESEKADKYMAMAFANKDPGQTQHVMGLMKEILLTQNKNLEIQLQAARDDTRKKDEIMAENERRHRQQLDELRKDFKQEAVSQTSPLLAYMQQQNSDSQKRMEIMFELQKSAMENQLAMVRENNANQMKMLTDSSSSQVSLLRGELERLSRELSEQRTANRGDLVGEIKKYRTMKDLFTKEGDEGGGPKSTMGAIIESLPVLASMIPTIKTGAQSLFGRGEQMVVRNPQARMPVPPPRRLAPPPPPGMRRVVRSPAPPLKPSEELPKIDQAKLVLGLDQASGMIEKAVTENKDPETFVKENIEGKFDQQVLKEIASAETEVLIPFIQSKVSNDESVLHTAKGESFLKKMHQALKARYS